MTKNDFRLNANRRVHRDWPRTATRGRLAAWASVGSLCAAAALLGPATSLAAGTSPEADGGSGATATHPAADPTVVADWNATAVDTILTDAVKGPAEAQLYFAFTQVAVYNAVVGITGRYEPYRWHPKAPHGASPEAAAAAAAHQLLMTYFAGSQPRLDAALTASLAKISDGRAENRGVAFGVRAANRIVALRANDGRDGDLQFTMPVRPGVWRPTATPPVPFFAPWLSQVEPLVMKAPDQFRPGPPPALTSKQYAREFNEVKALGSATSVERTPEQTQTALFFADTGVGGIQAALRDLVTRHGMNISESARLMAAVDTSIADSIIASWDAKFHYGFWRPVTAIKRAHKDGNPATARDSTWTSLIAAPPYPDYTSGLNAVVGAATRAVARVLGTNRIDLYLTSVAAAETRHYAYAGPINRDAIDARVWSGLHFRKADVVANHTGQRIATYVLANAFQPTGGHTSTS